MSLLSEQRECLAEKSESDIFGAVPARKNALEGHKKAPFSTIDNHRFCWRHDLSWFAVFRCFLLLLAWPTLRTHQQVVVVMRAGVAISLFYLLGVLIAVLPPLCFHVSVTLETMRNSI